MAKTEHFERHATRTAHDLLLVVRELAPSKVSCALASACAHAVPALTPASRLVPGLSTGGLAVAGDAYGHICSCMWL